MKYTIGGLLPPSAVEPTIFVDLDGTLSDDRHRVHLAHARRYDEYHELLGDDAVVPTVRDLLKVIESDVPILALTARPFRYAGATLLWLKKNGIALDGLLMRGDHDFSPAPKLKMKLLLEYFGDAEQMRSKTIVVLEDRDDVCEELRNAGLTVLQTKLGVG